MNKVVKASEQTSEDEECNDIQKKSETPYLKRGREDNQDDEGMQKMRKKQLKTDVGVDKIQRNQTLGTTASTIMKKNCNANHGSKDNDFDIKNDSIVLDDILDDFCTVAQAANIADSGREDVIGKQNSTRESCDSTDKNLQDKKHISEKEKQEKQTTVSTMTQSESEYSCELDDFFQEDFTANLAEFRTCRITSVEKERKYVKITIEDCQEQSTATVFCHGFWTEIKLEENDIVSIRAKKNVHDWIVDNDYGFIVTQSHILMSGTTIVGARFCMRRAVLAERFRGLDSLPNLETDDCGITIGTLVHELLQKVLMTKTSSVTEIRKFVNELLNTRRTMRMLYEANLSLKNCKQQMESYVPKIYNFMARYINGDGIKVKDKNFNGKIECVREIEENVWSPQLGMKGKVDVTVKATVNCQRKIMPLEIKTGNPSFSLDHRGQVILYCLMLKSLGQEIDAGLLLYIRENMMQEIKSNRPEERDLVILRNNLVPYITQIPELEAASKENCKTEKIWKPIQLPEPINFRLGCERCPYNTLCSLFAAKDRNLELPESHALTKIAKESMNHLKSEHIDYVMKWITMLFLEESGNHDVTSISDIWMLKPRTREKNGTCICNMEVCGDIIEEGTRYLHTFVRKYPDEEYEIMDLSQAHFTEADYIIVSTNTRINVSAGFVKRKSKHAIEMILDRDVVRQNPMETFHLDTYAYREVSVRSFASIACLLNNNVITNKLREIIIDKKPATFVETLPKSIVKLGAPLLFRLNKYQRKAVLSVFSANDYLLIKGMPGTGKTQTLVALIKLLVKMGQSVLISSHTHSAIDNILLKLNEDGVDFLRLGSQSRIHPALIHKSEDVVTADCTTPESLEAIYSSKKIVAVTCLGATHRLVEKRIFDVCLVDESTQVLQPLLLRPIYSASKFVLVGDPQQLPPVSRNDDARKMGMNESLFVRLDNENNTVTLALQYRMNRRIMAVANDLTYKGCLKAGSSQVSDATLTMKDTMILESCEKWVSKALSLNCEDSVVMLNTGETHALNAIYDIDQLSKNRRRVRNVCEAAIILRLVSVLIKGGVKASSIGVICPFRAQVELLRHMTTSKDIEVNTVDQYQGRDKDVIFYSCTRSAAQTSNESGDGHILQDFQRLNVAVTRAKHKLILIGDKLALTRFTPFKKLFDVIKNNIIDLMPGRDDFTWESLVLKEIPQDV